MRTILFTFCFAVLISSCGKQESSTEKSKPVLKALIVDGQNNHYVWPKTTMMMKTYLEQTGLFTVDVARTAYTWQGSYGERDREAAKRTQMDLLKAYAIPGMKETTMTPEPTTDPNFNPDFSAYDVVISNFGWMAAPWPEATRAALEMYVSGGGGFVVVHAANNSFPEWAQFNRMIGLGGWGDRTEKSGPYMYYNNKGEVVRDTTAGPGGSHGKEYLFEIIVRDSTHGITKGMPSRWPHAQDELYDRLRGPAEELSILATAYADVEKNDSPFSELRGTDRHEPMLMTIDYGKGRVFHTPLGHADYSMECVGFITSFQRGVEWAATGNVTLPLPADFPRADSVRTRKFEK